MNKRQKESFLELGLGDGPGAEAYLDGLEPNQFRRINWFGEHYIDYVREMRGLPVVGTESLLDAGTEDALGLTEAPYVLQPTTYHPLEDGSADVRITINLTTQQAHWLEDLDLRLHTMYKGDSERSKLSYHVRRMVLDVMKMDSERSGGTEGTMSRGDYNARFSASGGSKTYT
jgi:hypothetical protein